MPAGRGQSVRRDPHQEYVLDLASPATNPAVDTTRFILRREDIHGQDPRRGTWGNANLCSRYIPLDKAMTLVTNRFTVVLRAITAELRPYSEVRSKGSKYWDGTKYVDVTEDSAGRFQCGAAIWRVTLDTIADMIETQGYDVPEEQRTYLRRTVFGGMGALHDFGLDETNDPEARASNARLVALYRELGEAFESR
jgi:hypothetical protein